MHFKGDTVSCVKGESAEAVILRDLLEGFVLCACTHAAGHAGFRSEFCDVMGSAALPLAFL